MENTGTHGACMKSVSDKQSMDILSDEVHLFIPYLILMDWAFSSRKIPLRISVGVYILVIAAFLLSFEILTQVLISNVIKYTWDALKNVIWQINSRHPKHSDCGMLCRMHCVNWLTARFQKFVNFKYYFGISIVRRSHSTPYLSNIRLCNNFLWHLSEYS